jgi:hypothetical protein
MSVIDRLASLTRKQWASCIGAAAICSALLIGILYFVPPVWSSKVEIQIKMPVMTPGSLSLRTTPSSIALGLFTSQAVLQTAAEAEKLSMKDFTKTIDIQEVVGANQIVISTEAATPELGRDRLVNVISAARQVDRDWQSTISEESMRLLIPEVMKWRADTEATELLLASIIVDEETGGLSVYPDQVAQDRSRITQLEVRLEVLDAQLSKQKSQALDAIKSDSSAPNAAIDPALRDARKQLQEKRVELEKARITLGPEAPDLKRLEAEARVLETQVVRLADAATSIVNDGLSQDLSTLVVERESTALELKLRKAAFQGTPPSLLEYQRLERQAKVQAQVLGDLENRLAVAKVGQQVSDVAWAVLASPETDPEPINKRYLPYGLLCFGLSLLIALIIAVWRADLPKESKATGRPA